MSEEVEIELKTKLPEEYRVPDDPIMVPAQSGRWALSELVNELLKSEDEDRQVTPFDFLVDGRFLRTSLAAWMASHERTAETRITLEYTLCMGKPETSSVDKREAWVACVTASGGRVLAGWFDGVGKAYGPALQWQHGTALRSLAAASVDSSKHVVVAGTEDGEVTFAVVDQDRVITGVGAQGAAVTACAVNDDASLAATADAVGNVRLWHVDAVGALSANGKRPANTKEPKLSLEGHQGSVCACVFHDFNLFTASQDQHVRVWDSLTGSLVASWPCRAAATTAATRADGKVLATAHVDGAIQIWDVRSNDGNMASSSLEIKSVLRTHQRLVSGVAWAPGDEFRIASSSHDQMVKVYDIRSSAALQSVQLEAKATCVAWDAGDVLSGAADGEVRRHVLK